MERDFSPEERLLRLIKGKKFSPKKPVPKPSNQFRPIAEIPDEPLPGPEPPEASEVSALKAPVPKEEEAAKKNKPAISKDPVPLVQPRQAKVPKAPPFSFNINYLYAVAGVVALFLLGFFIFNGLINKNDEEIENLQLLINSISEVSKEVPPERKEQTPSKESAASKKEPRQKKASSFADYQKLLKDKKVFEPAVTQRRRTGLSEDSALREAVKQFNLVGTIPGDEPQAIVEDKRTGQTLFLKKGEAIDNIEVMDISNGRIILGYEGETITLSL